MQRTSKSWTSGDPATAAEFNKIRDDFDELFVKGSERLKIFKLTTDGALVVRVGAGTYRVWGTEWQYAGGTVTVGASVTTYIMINSAGAIQTSTSAWDGQYARLGVVVSSGGVITSITQWRNDAVGGDFWGTPTGAITLWSTNTAPTWYLLCDWSAVSRTTYGGLFALISTTYGVGDGSTTFNLPNLKWRVPVGRDSGQTEFDVMGETGGAKTHTLLTAEMPAHTHTLPVANGSSGGGGNTGAQGDYFWALTWGNFTTSATGGGGAHNNLQPYLVLNYIIKT